MNGLRRVRRPVAQRIVELRIRGIPLVRFLQTRVALEIVGDAAPPATRLSVVYAERERPEGRVLQPESAVVEIVLADPSGGAERPQIVRHDVGLGREPVPRTVGDIVMADLGMLANL